MVREVPARGNILRVALPVPIRRLFDYFVPEAQETAHHIQLKPGLRVKVPFGKSHKTGVIIEIVANSDIAADRLKACTKVLDHTPLFSEQHLDLLRWASAYYHHAIGDVVVSALPVGLRKGLPAVKAKITIWHLEPLAPAANDPCFKRAPKQAELIALLRKSPTGLEGGAIQAVIPGWRSVIKRLQEKGWVKVTQQIPEEYCGQEKSIAEELPDLNKDQNLAVQKITASLNTFKVYLLNGVTGSGKTEVYFRVIDKVVSMGQQALILIPEIGLTTQLIGRFKQRFNCVIAVLHSGLNDSERIHSWLQAEDGTAQIIIGTRSAVWTPLARPGLIVVDEEHDLSYKQQEGFRYSARDVAIMRSQRGEMPIILGSATPSLESINSADQGRYQHLSLTERAGNAQQPTIRLIDICRARLISGLAPAVVEKINTCVTSGKQALLFLNRRGFAPVMMCHNCGWVGACEYCDSHLTFHQSDKQMRCHHCGAQQAMIKTCPECADEEAKLVPVGQGTERITETLENLFPQARLLRIDRDSTRKKGEMSRMLDKVNNNEVDILVGTQMLSKGHHFPNVTLVVVLDADNRLYGTDFRATERLVQLIIQVAGRAGRAQHPGEVLIQTHHPDHPLLKALATNDFTGLAKELMAERSLAALPPFASVVLIRAEAMQPGEALAFLGTIKACQPTLTHLAPEDQVIEVWGPVVAQMERRAGRYRAQLMVLSKQRRVLQWLMTVWVPEIERLKKSSTLRWSIDVDPQDTF